jgi:hypothetical protein
MVWLTESDHLMNQSAHPAESEDVPAALPTRATRDSMNGNNTTCFNRTAADAARAISHEVKATLTAP